MPDGEAPGHEEERAVQDRSRAYRMRGSRSDAHLAGDDQRAEERAVVTDQDDGPAVVGERILQRLDGLETRERRFLQDASVLGKTFTKRALAALSSR